MFFRFSVLTQLNLSVREAKLAHIPSYKMYRHRDMIAYVFKWIQYPHLLTENDYQSYAENSLVRSYIKNTTAFVANFVKYR